MKNVHTALVMSARTYIEKEPNYTYVTARLLLNELREEGLFFLNMPHRVTQTEMAACYPECLSLFIDKGIEKELLDPRLKEFDLAKRNLYKRRSSPVNQSPSHFGGNNSPGARKHSLLPIAISVARLVTEAA